MTRLHNTLVQTDVCYVSYPQMNNCRSSIFLGLVKCKGVPVGGRMPGIIISQVIPAGANQIHLCPRNICLGVPTSQPDQPRGFNLSTFAVSMGSDQASPL